jgi:hypothetical protein
MGGVKSLTDLYAALRSPVSVMATLMQGTRRATATDVQLCHNAPGAPTRVTLYGSTIRHVAQDLYYPIGKYLLVASFWRGNCRVCRCRKAGYGSEPNAVTPPSFCGPRCIYSNHGRPAVSASRSRYKSVADAIASLATHHHPIPAIPRDDYWHETCNTLQQYLLVTPPGGATAGPPQCRMRIRYWTLAARPAATSGPAEPANIHRFVRKKRSARRRRGAVTPARRTSVAPVRYGLL